MENDFRGDTHDAIDEQLAMYPAEATEQGNDTDNTYFVPGTLDERLLPAPLTPTELRNVRQEAIRNGVSLPERDEDLQKLIRSYHAENLFND